MYRSLLTAMAIAALATTPSFAAAPAKRISNNVKYKDSAPYKRAAAAGASIQTRALLGRDGTTTIEITTGDFDVPNSTTGTLEKVQLKVAGKNGWTKNYNNASSSGSFSLPVTGLTRGTVIQIHANVRTPRNMQVLQVTDTVRLRPDLQAATINAPSTVTAGVPVSISATVRELNGDTGARATCALSVDDRLVDTASNIWVDAGGSVQCLFSTTLTSGPRRLSVTVGNVVPGDWDTRNNTATATVNVASANSNVWSANASQKKDVEKYVTTRSDRPNMPDTDERTTIVDLFAFNGTLPYTLNLDNLNIRYVEKTDGQQIQNVAAIIDLPNGACRLLDGRNLVMSVCNTSNGKATLNINRRGSETLYLSRFWNAQYNGETGETKWDQYVMEYETTQGARPRYANSVTADITLTDGKRTWTADPFINLQPYQNAPQSSRTCREDAAGVTICTDSWKQTTGKTGSDQSQ